MAGRRDAIKMSPSEIEIFLAEVRPMSVATHGPDGEIHLVAMWYGFLGGDLAFWTYAKSQKVANLRRQASLTILVEAGRSYDQLRGVEIVGAGEITTDPKVVREIGESVYSRYVGGFESGAREVFLASASKRVGVIVRPKRIVSWDHTKLGGSY